MADPTAAPTTGDSVTGDRTTAGAASGAPPAEPTSFRRRHPVLVYSLARLLLLVLVWLPLQLLTPLRGVMAVLVALLLSGVLSFLVLDRQRDAVSIAVGRVFRRIDERIERSRTAEDDDDIPVGPPAAEADPESDPEAVPEADPEPVPPVGGSGGQAPAESQQKAEGQQ